MKEKKADEINNFLLNIEQTVITEIVKRDDEIIKQAIKDYFKEKYPEKNLRFNFLDEEIVNQILGLGIAEYQRKQALGGALIGCGK